MFLSKQGSLLTKDHFFGTPYTLVGEWQLLGILMFVDVIINLLSVYTKSNIFIRKANLVEQLAQYQVTEEIMVSDNTAMEENIKYIAGKVGRKHRIWIHRQKSYY